MGKIRTGIKQLLGFIYYFYQKYILKNSLKANMGYWFWKNGDNKYLLNHNLTESSVVFEVGGFTGVFTQRIVSKFNPVVYVFEPVKDFTQELKNKFGDNTKVHILNFGLGAKTRTEKINLIDDKSSILREDEVNEGEEVIEILDIADFINKENIQKIDLMNINIEGGEYELLPRLIESGLIDRVEFIQVQFHKVLDNSEEIRNDIISKLKETHEEVFSIEFVWDGFRKKSH